MLPYCIALVLFQPTGQDNTVSLPGVKGAYSEGANQAHSSAAVLAVTFIAPC